MDAKIMSEIWDRLEEQPPEVKLTVVWCLTNPSRDACGVFRRSPGRFKLQTGLEPRWLDETMTRLPRMFVQDGDLVLCKNFTKYQIGVGQRMADNNMSTSMIKPFTLLSPRLQEAILEVYPELTRKLSPYQALTKPLPTTLKPLPSPYQALTDNDKPLEVNELTEVPPTGQAEDSLSLSQGLPKPLASASRNLEAQAKIRERSKAKISTGECEGGGGEEESGVSSQGSAEPGAGDPTLAEVLTRAGMIGMSEADGKAFFEHYAGLGWMYGNTRMAKWWHWLPRWRARSQSFAQGKNAAPAPGSLAEIEDELAWQENPKRKAELLRKRAAMGGKA